MKIYRYSVLTGVLSVLSLFIGCAEEQNKNKIGQSAPSAESPLQPQVPELLEVENSNTPEVNAQESYRVPPLVDYSSTWPVSRKMDLILEANSGRGYWVNFVGTNPLPSWKLYRRDKDRDVEIQSASAYSITSSDTTVIEGQSYRYVLKENEKIIKLWEVEIPKDLVFSGSYSFPNLPCERAPGTDHHYCTGYGRIFLNSSYFRIGSETLILSAKRIISNGAVIESVPIGVHTAPGTDAPRAGSIQLMALEASGNITLSVRGVGGAPSHGQGGRGGDAGSMKIMIEKALGLVLRTDCPGGVGGNPENPDLNRRGPNGWGCTILHDINGTSGKTNEYFRFNN